MSNPLAKNMLGGIHSRVVAQLNIDNLEDKITAGNQIRAETNLMMIKFENALKERYHKTHKEMYGFKDEDNTMKIMRSNIASVISSYSHHGTGKPSSV